MGHGTTHQSDRDDGVLKPQARRHRPLKSTLRCEGTGPAMQLDRVARPGMTVKAPAGRKRGRGLPVSGLRHPRGLLRLARPKGWKLDASVGLREFGANVRRTAARRCQDDGAGLDGSAQTASSWLISRWR